MAMLSLIRRLHLRDGVSIRGISDQTGLSRNTVRRYLRCGSVEPRFQTPSRPGKLDSFSEKLSGWLTQEARQPRKQRRTVRQLHADLASLGYGGSYGRVAAFIRRWRADRHRQEQTTGRGVFVPLSFGPGEAFQFDWSENHACIGGERIKLQVAHMKLCYSKAFIVRAYPLQTHEMLFDAHNHSFRVLGGVPRRGIYDNMKTAVDKVRRGKERQINARFLAMTSHYLFDPDFCNPASGWEKGQVEKNVRDTRHQLWQPMPCADTLDDLNAMLEQRCRALWEKTAHGGEPGSIAEVLEQERAHLMPVAPPFDGFVEFPKRVSPTCLIHFERNRYSVPATFANCPVSLRVYPDRLVIAADGATLCEHRRIIDRNHGTPGRTVYDWRHYLAVIQRKPGALRNGAPFTELPAGFRALQQQLRGKPGGDREMVEILALVLQHDEQDVLAATELALDEGSPTKTHILNVLHRVLDGKPNTAPAIETPWMLALALEPTVDAARYDDLRMEQEARHAP